MGLLRKTCHLGVAQIGGMLTIATIMYNLVHMHTLAPAA